jgi:hypothetical protein
MTDAVDPQPLVVESSAACPGLARLPSLPVRVLILTAPELEDPDRRSLADRLSRRTDELGVADGVAVAEESFSTWELAPGAASHKRFDIVLFRPGAVPALDGASAEPAEEVVDVLARVLCDLETRFWVLDPPPRGAPEGEDARRLKLCRDLANRGAPPAVRLPTGWDTEQVPGFYEDLLEWVLHDAPLIKAVSRATGDRRPLPAIFQPAGGRFGLDLGRLLEDHRKQIGEESNKVRVFQRELEAARPEVVGDRHEIWARLGSDVSARLEALERVREQAAEINRDRDPAGWSRLAANIDELKVIQREGHRDRDQLLALRLVADRGDL